MHRIRRSPYLKIIEDVTQSALYALLSVPLLASSSVAVASEAPHFKLADPASLQPNEVLLARCNIEATNTSANAAGEETQTDTTFGRYYLFADSQNLAAFPEMAVWTLPPFSRVVSHEGQVSVVTRGYDHLVEYHGQSVDRYWKSSFDIDRITGALTGRVEDWNLRLGVYDKKLAQGALASPPTMTELVSDKPTIVQLRHGTCEGVDPSALGHSREAMEAGFHSTGDGVVNDPTLVCDLLASSATDPHRIAPGVSLNKSLARYASPICVRAAELHPDDLTIMNSLMAINIVADRTDQIYYAVANAKYADTFYQVAQYDWSKERLFNTQRWLRRAADLGHAAAVTDLYFIYSHKYRIDAVKNLFEVENGLNQLAASAKQNYDPNAASLAEKYLREAFPGGFRSRAVSDSDRRELVEDTEKYPFSAFGRLDASFSGGSATCTAQVVGNQRTIVTAAHCLTPGATYQFRRGVGLAQKVEATVVARGECCLSMSYDPTAASSNYDDWAVLDLASPLEASALGLTMQFDGALNGGWATRHYIVAGYPADLYGAEKMTSAIGCGFHPYATGYHESFLASTKCRSYHGLSGAAILVQSADGKYYMMGLVKGFRESEPDSTDLVLSRHLALAVCTKMNANVAGSCDVEKLTRAAEPDHERPEQVNMTEEPATR